MRRSLRLAMFLLPGIVISFLGCEAGDAKPLGRFELQVIDPSGPTTPWAKGYGDVNGDGLIDIIVGAHGKRPSLLERILHKLNLNTQPVGKGELVWYQNPAWERHLITTDYAIRTDLATGDLDADGDQDVLVTTDDGLIWLKNPGWAPRFLSDRKLHDVMIVDLNGDNLVDIVARNQSGFGYNDGNEVLIFLNDAQMQWTAQSLPVPHGEGLWVADIDNSGFPDVIVNGVWLSNPGRRPDGKWVQRAYGGQWDWPDVMVRVADIDDDGQPDIVLTPSEPAGERYRISWFANPGTTGKAWIENVVDADVEAVLHSLAVGDFDGDSQVDILTAEMNQGIDPDEVRLYVNPGQRSKQPPVWRSEVIDTRGLHNLEAVDIDGDLDLDFFGTNWQFENFDSDYPVRLWLNTSSQQLSWRRIVVDGDRPWPSLFIRTADLNRDGVLEVITGGWIYDRKAADVEQWLRHPIGPGANNVVIADDVDGDGDKDLLTSGWVGFEYQPPLGDRILNRLGLKHLNYDSMKGNRFLWMRNDGNGQFDAFDDAIEGSGDFLQGAAKFCDPQRCSIVIAWHGAGEQAEPLQMLSLPGRGDESRIVSLTETHDEAIEPGDIDRDGDEDLTLGTRWLENVGDGRLLDHRITAVDEKPDRVRLVDLDQDDRLDVVVGYEAVSKLGKLAWYRQPSHPTLPWQEHIVAQIIGPMSVDAGDVDGDMDIDIVAGEHNLAHPTQSRLFWFENLGNAARWRAHLIYRGDEHHDGAHLADVDNDGDLDVLSIGWGHAKVLLYLNPLGREEPNHASHYKSII